MIAAYTPSMVQNVTPVVKVVTRVISWRMYAGIPPEGASSSTIEW